MLKGSLDLHPSGVVRLVSERITFYCLKTGGGYVTDIQWLIEGQPLNTLNLRNVTPEFDPVVMFGALTFGDLSADYHLYEIKCLMMFRGRLSPDVSPSQTLLVQGLSII